MRPFLALVFRNGLLGVVLSCTAAGAMDRPPMPSLPLAERGWAAKERWLKKPVLESRLLDDMEAPDKWERFGPGEMSLTTERRRDGQQSIRLESPTQTEKPGPVMGRPFAETGLRRRFDDEDWSQFNRVSFWVYPNLPGFNVVSFLVRLQAEGSDGWSYTHGALNFVLLRHGQWNQVVWEIPHLERGKVRALDFVYRLQGHEPEATSRVCFDLDQLELQRVEPDPSEGWTGAPGQIAYNHLGYRASGLKAAVGCAGGTGPRQDRFQVLNAETGKAVLDRPIRANATDLGAFELLDFSELRKPGVYRLRRGASVTEPFVVGPNPFWDTLWATLNLFYCQRCGDAVPGVHGYCHRDWLGVHGDKRVLINGGWHDAGDLSQGLVNTAEAAYAMLAVADRLAAPVSAPERRAPGPAPLPGDARLLAERFLQEARWGLEWLNKTRFGDGARVTWATMDFWTDGILGTADDVTAEARNAPFDNLTAAATAARASRILRGHGGDAAQAEYCLRTAVEDWRFALEKTAGPGVELAAAGASAGVELFLATRQGAYLEKAVEFAEVLVQSQERRTQTGWSLPLRGFFYTSPRKDRLLTYFHRSHEQAPVTALAALCEAAPDHPAWMDWYSAVVLYSEYLQRAAQATAPWQMLPAGVYRLGPSTDAARRAQVTAGIRLDEDHYLRRFPVWGDFRGNLGVQLSQAKALSRAGVLRRRPELRALAHTQLDWVLGRNPFAQSLMYGVGHNYHPQYTAMSGDIVGSLPVGIQTRREADQPYWPTSNCYNYAELWVHPSARWLAILADLLEPVAEAPPCGFGEFRLEPVQGQSGRIRVAVVARGRGRQTFTFRWHNLESAVAELSLELHPRRERRIFWEGQVKEASEPWVVIAFPEGHLDQRQELAEVAGR